MNINLHIEVGSPEELQEALAGLAAITGGAVTTKTVTATEEPSKPKRSKKQERQQDPEPEAADESTDSTIDPENIPAVVDLRAAAQAKGTTLEGKKAIKALLDEFGSKSISDVPEEKRSAFLAKLEEL